MDIENIKKRAPQSVRNTNINIKVSQAASNWLKEKEYSPTGIFNEAMKELGFMEPEEMAADLKEIEDPAPDRDIDAETEQIEAIEQELHPES